MQQPEWSKMNIKMYKHQSDRSSNYTPKQRLSKKTKNYINSNGRFVNTKSYALAWGVINKPYSSKELYNKCKNDPQAPSYYFIVNKGWKGYHKYYQDLIKAGMQPRQPRNDTERRKIIGRISKKGFKIGLLNKDYDVARMAAQYGITTRRSYDKIRNENPELKEFFPSVSTIIKRFGNWSRFTHEIMKYNADMVITQYVTKSAQCGHWLKLSQCDKLNIPIRGIMDILRPTIFNALCYKKLSLMNKSI